MDAAANENEVRLRKGTSLNERLVLAGIAIVVCLIALPGLAHLANDQWLGIAALFAPVRMLAAGQPCSIATSSGS